MTQLLNIFSKAKHKKIKKEQPQKIIIDYREKNSLVPAKLKSLGLDVEFKNLKVGDYLTNGVAVERKTISDFLSSMINKRLLRQIEELQQYRKKILIVEGFEEQNLYEINHIDENAIRGFILSISLKSHIPIIFSQNPEDTANFISVIAKKKKQISTSLNVNKKSLNQKEQAQFVLEGFPGIGPSTSKKLLKEFKTLKNIFNSPIEKLKEAIGKKAEVFSILDKNYK